MEQLSDQGDNPIAADFSLWSLLAFSLPTVIMMIFMGLYTIVDSILISRFVGTNGLSALNIVTPVINIIVGIGGMLATGANALIARNLGEGKNIRASQDFSFLIFCGVLLGTCIALVGYTCMDALIWILGASELLFSYCKSYLSVLLLFTPAAMLQILFQNLLVTAGKPTLGLGVSLSAGILNIFLDYVFIVQCDMGIAGAALGTGIGYMVPSITGILVFLQRKGVLRFCRPIIKLNVLWKSLTNGFSEMVSQSATAITTFLFNITMMRLAGEDGVAAITIMIYAQFLLTSLYIGFSMGASPLLSFNHGSRNHGRLARIFNNSLWIIGISSCVICISAQLLGPSLVSIFSPKGTSVYRMASQGFRIFSFSFLFSGFTIFTSAAFTAFSDGKRSAIISIMRTFVCLVIALLTLPRIWQETGVWLAVPCSEFVSMLIAFRLLHTNRYVYHYA
ncbi:MAG: MATE family efflux transporter [Sphaerochaetaceae bacterium]